MLASVTIGLYVCLKTFEAMERLEKLSYRQAEALFKNSGPFIHLNTSHLESDLLVENDEDRTVILNMIALLSAEHKTEVLAYAIMSNHLHLILRGNAVTGREFFERLAARISRYLASKGKPGIMKDVTCTITPIASLKQFRDEIVYVIRNPFVVRDDIHLFAYRWCSGYLYFNPMLPADAGKPAAKASYRERRIITRSSDNSIPENFRIDDTLLLPESFVNYRLVESLFDNARQFLFWALKNVEAQVEIAHQHGEIPHLSDDEMFIQSRQICETEYGVKKPELLGDAQKKELAVTLRNRYHASNGQIARFTSLSLLEVNKLYPLSAKSAAEKL